MVIDLVAWSDLVAHLVAGASGRRSGRGRCGHLKLSHRYPPLRQNYIAINIFRKHTLQHKSSKLDNSGETEERTIVRALFVAANL